MDPLDFDVLNDQPVPTYQAAPPANPPTFQTPTGQQVRRPSFNSTQPGLQEQYANDGNFIFKMSLENFAFSRKTARAVC